MVKSLARSRRKKHNIKTHKRSTRKVRYGRHIDYNPLDYSTSLASAELREGVAIIRPIVGKATSAELDAITVPNYRHKRATRGQSRKASKAIKAIILD